MSKSLISENQVQIVHCTHVDHVQWSCSSVYLDLSECGWHGSNQEEVKSVQWGRYLCTNIYCRPCMVCNIESTACAYPQDFTTNLLERKMTIFLEYQMTVISLTQDYWSRILKIMVKIRMFFLSIFTINIHSRLYKVKRCLRKSALLQPPCLLALSRASLS